MILHEFRIAIAGFALMCLATPALASAPTAAAADTGGGMSPALEAQLPDGASLPPVHLPRPRQARLPNGLRILMLEDSAALPTFTMRVVFTDGGGLYEPADRRGLANFTAKMLREGTASRSADDVARMLETLGLQLETRADIGSAIGTITLSGLSNRFAPGLDLLAELIRDPAFRDADVARHAAVEVAGLQVKRTQPEFLGQDKLLRAIYGAHPAALAAAPVEAIEAIRGDDLRRFHDLHYRPDAALIVIVGRLTLEQVLPQLRRAFADWQPRKRAPAAIPAVPPQPPSGIDLVDRPGSVQTLFQLGVLGLTRTDPGYFPLLVMNEIMGGQSSSRLYQNLRERHGYTYGAYSGFQASQIPGVWQITTSVRNGVVGEALGELLAEVNRMRQEAVTPEELADARRALVGKYIFGLEQPDRLIDNLVTAALYDLPADYWDRYPQYIENVSRADVTRVAQRLLLPEHLQIAAVGDAATIREDLARHGSLRGGEEKSAIPASVVSQQPPPEPLFSKEEKTRLRDTVGQIADALIAAAVEEKDGLSWPVDAGEGADMPYAALDFYTGTPGDCYFLLKAYQLLGDARYLRAAERGMAYLLSRIRTDEHGAYLQPVLNGVFEGNAGAGYLFLYAHRVTGEQRHLQTAQAIARRMIAVPDVGEKSSPDIISGAAGVGLFLLDMHAVTGDAGYTEGARRLGDFLIERAEPRTAGVTWKLYGPPGGRQPEYYFVGFSHGPAGIAYYLDRLHRVTGQDRYRAAADQAMAYIEHVAIREGDHVKWFHEELRRRTRYSSQWCHGAPGMNPVFLAFHQRSANPEYLGWAATNTRYLLDQGVNVRANPSVCHGVTGNTASLYGMYRTTGDPQYAAAIRSAVELLYGTMKQGPHGVYWDAPDYDPDYRRDYSYMTGLAGIGDFFVLLATDGRLNMFGPLGYGDDLAAPVRSGGREAADGKAG